MITLSIACMLCMTHVRLDVCAPRGGIARSRHAPPLLREWARRGRSLAAEALIFTGALLCRVNVHGGDFVRADANGDGAIDIGDAVAVLG